MYGEQDGATVNPAIPAQRRASADGDPDGAAPFGAAPCSAHRPTPLDLPTQRASRGPRIPAMRPAEIEVPDYVRDRARSEVLHRHARLGTGGRPIFCTPSRAEIAGAVALRQGRGTDGKVIYDTRDAAELAARELEALGARSLRPYLCGRSRRGHFHLATAARSVHVPGQRVSGQTAPCLHDRIPQQRGPLSA